MPDGHAPESDPTLPDVDVLDKAIVAFMANDEIEVPPLPHVLLRLQSLVASDNFSADDLAAVVRADQMLSATVLRYANRSAAMRSSAIVSLPEAIARIGARELVDVAFGATLGSHASKAGPLLPMRRLVWQQAVVGAILGRLLAPKFKIDPGVGFLAGLLHDFGKVIALGAVESIVDAALTPSAPVPFWSALIERYHVELGIVAAVRWNLPDPYPDVIGAHHTPESAGDARNIVNLVNYCDLVCEQMATSTGLGEFEIKALATRSGGVVDSRSLEKAIERLPGAVSALTSFGKPPKKSDACLVEKDEVTSVEGKFAGMTVEFAKGDEKHSFAVTDLTHEGVCAQGDYVLSEGFVARSTLADDSVSIEMFLHVKTCEQTNLVRIKAGPFCLGPAEQRQYTEMVRRSE